MSSSSQNLRDSIIKYYYEQCLIKTKVPNDDKDDDDDDDREEN